MLGANLQQVLLLRSRRLRAMSAITDPYSLCVSSCPLWLKAHCCSTISSWQVMQYRLHGTAVNRFTLMSWPQCMHSPNVPLLMRPIAASTNCSSPRSCAFCRNVISFESDAVALSPSSRPKSCASLCSSCVRLRLRRSSSRFLLRSSSNFAILAFSMRNHFKNRKCPYGSAGPVEIYILSILIEICLVRRLCSGAQEECPPNDLPFREPN